MATGNALGGASFNLSNFQRERRRDVRLHTCTISASGQFIHIPDGSGIVINDVDDLIAQPHLRICTGNLSTQLVTQYFGNVDPVLYPDRVFTQRFLDIAFCTKRVLDGDADIIVLSLPDLDATGATWPTFLPPHLRPTWTAVDTKITAGTPYWIATQKPE
jgi:ABC-type amino acid transport substrate-binding protein